jgi:predicted transcriptional regulator
MNKHENELAAVVDLSIKLLDLKVSDLANQSGLATSQITRFCKGERDLTAANFFKIVYALPQKARMVIYDCLESKEYDKEQVAVKLLGKNTIYLGKREDRHDTLMVSETSIV